MRLITALLISLFSLAGFSQDGFGWEHFTIIVGNDTITFSTANAIDANLGGTRALYCIDLDGDSDIDVVAAGANANDIVWYENDGSENFTKHTIDTDMSGLCRLDCIDIDKDGDIDLSVIVAYDVVWYENDGSESFTKHTNLLINQQTLVFK